MRTFNLLVGGWKKRMDHAEARSDEKQSRQLVVPDTIDRSDANIESDDMADDDHDDLMQLIRDELERFINEQQPRKSYERSISGEDNFPVQSPVYEVLTNTATAANDDQNQEIRSYNAPIIDDFKQSSPVSQYDLITNDQLIDRSSAVPGSNAIFLDNFDHKPKPDKLLEMIPQGQRDKYPVEVEEISYEEYLELSRKGDTFEEPLYEDFGICSIKLIY